MTTEFEDAVETDVVETDIALEPARAHDARGDVPITETTERFLRALLVRVPLERVAELYLFAPLRQGAIETGIAVIAARAIEAPEPSADVDVPACMPSEGVVMAEEDVIEIDEVVVNAEEVEIEIDGVAVTVEEVVIEVDAVAVDIADVRTDVGAADGYDDSPYLDDTIADEVVSATADEPVAEYVVPIRYTVYTARYRLVVKGPERGKWEIDVVDEADAPLLTVETVVGGVQRRAGEETATVRYDAAQLAHVLRLDPSLHS